MASLTIRASAASVFPVPGPPWTTTSRASLFTAARWATDSSAAKLAACRALCVPGCGCVLVTVVPAAGADDNAEGGNGSSRARVPSVLCLSGSQAY
jgi:hypothetical protein